VFCRRKWFQGQPIKGHGVVDIAWLRPDGDEMSEENWNQEYAKSLGVFLNGQGIHTHNIAGEQIIDDSFYILFNAHHESIDFRIPVIKYGNKWTKILDTDKNYISEDGEHFYANQKLKVEGRSIIVLKKIS
jgi:glycogen operon protein